MSRAEDTEIWFYHLQHTSVVQVVVGLVEKVLARGWRAEVSSPLDERIETLDDALWQADERSFLPHGRWDEPRAARQPVLLSPKTTLENQPDVVILLDEAAFSDLKGLKRAILIFDGHNEAAVARAREMWTKLKSHGHPMSYWQQTESGGWQKKAEQQAQPVAAAKTP